MGQVAFVESLFSFWAGVPLIIGLIISATTGKIAYFVLSMVLVILAALCVGLGWIFEWLGANPLDF